MTVMPERPAGSTPVGLLARLRQIQPGPQWVVSCYLRTTREDRLRAGYLVELKNRIRGARDALATRSIARAARQAIDRDLDRILAAIRDPAHLPPSPGLALFACEELGLFEVAPLPLVFRTRVSVDHTPSVREVVAAEQELGRVLTAVVDRAHARFFEVTARGAVELRGLSRVATRGGKFHENRGGSPGWGERDYHNRIARERERHFAAAAHRLLEIDRERPARGIVVAGPTSDPAAVARFLDIALAQRLLGTARLKPATAGPAQVEEATREACGRHERELERVEVWRMLEGLGDGWAVNGVQQTMRALSRGQVRTLLVSQDTEALEADEAIEEALAQRVRVLIVRDPAAAAKVSHLAGVLRFR